MLSTRKGYWIRFEEDSERESKVVELVERWLQGPSLFSRYT